MTSFESTKLTLTGLLTTADNIKLYRYMLIDELASINDFDYISVSSLQQLLGKDRVTTLVRPNLSHDHSSCPKLITLAEPDEQIDVNIIHFSLIQAKGECQERSRFICGWFVSEHPPESITEQFILLGDRLASYCKTAFIPIYEPFRIFLLQNSNSFCPEWFLSSLKFLKTYAYLTIDSELEIINGLNDAQNDLFLDFDAQFLQKEARATFYFYKAWREVEQNLTQRPQISAKTIFENYYKAYEWQLTNINDRSIFGLMNLRYGGNIISNENIAKAVVEAQKEPGTLADKFKQLDKSNFIQTHDNQF